jgi:hypothetical protein
MKKTRLQINYSYDFELVGIISSAKGFKLAWDINALLNIRLIRQPDLKVHFADKTVAGFTHFCHESPLNRVRLFRNKPSEAEASKHTLVPEFSHLDFILMTQGDEGMANKRLQEYLRTISSVELVAFLPLDALKFKDYFIF